ncbi:MAG: WD40/YVTN/BNR-like repeat-containing protein, partial [Candidatus Kapaibacteriota bacterium]
PKTLYIGSQYLHRSYDHGDTWTRLSPDLTTNDSNKYNPVNSGGVTRDVTSAENHCTIYSISESPLDEQIIWVGTDDGNIQVTTNGGKQWTNASLNLPSSIQKNTWVSCVEAGHFDKGTAYVTLDNHTRGDHQTYLLRSTDFGKTWIQLKGDSLRGYAHVIREDPVNRNVVFAGTEYGLFVSIDAGNSWAQFKNDMPVVPVRDLAIHPKTHDLIIATHGRGVFIIDDLTPLRNLAINNLQSELMFLPVRPSEQSYAVGFQEFSGTDEFTGSNPSDGARFAYFMKSRHMIGSMSIDILDPNTGDVISSIPASKRKGINLVSWNMSTKSPRVAISPNTGGGNFGYSVLPGTYTVRIRKNGQEYKGSVTINADKRSIHTPQDRQAQHQVAKRLWGLIDDLAFTAEQTTALRDSLKLRMRTIMNDEEQKMLKASIAYLDSLHKHMVAEKSTLFADSEDKLREKLAGIY